jgi:ribosomal protein S18 acetylase RimI-like enzyme
MEKVVVDLRAMISLRPATPADFDRLYEIHRAASQEMVAKTWGKWDESWQRDYFRDHFDCTKRQVIELDGQSIGLLDVVIHFDHVFLAAIEIAPEYHGQGIGTALIESSSTKAAALDLPVRLQVLKVNERARRLYERLGFVQTCETKTHFLMHK